jgi:hypothetical protein
LRDLHQPLTDEDYDLLRFALPYCPNLRVITLEYYGPADLLIRQLQALRQILNVTQLSP